MKKVFGSLTAIFTFLLSCAAYLIAFVAAPLLLPVIIPAGILYLIWKYIKSKKEIPLSNSNEISDNSNKHINSTRSNDITKNESIINKKKERVDSMKVFSEKLFSKENVSMFKGKSKEGFESIKGFSEKLFSKENINEMREKSSFIGNKFKDIVKPRNDYDSVLENIEKLGKLKDNGIITDEEFIEQKKKLLSL